MKQQIWIFLALIMLATWSCKSDTKEETNDTAEVTELSDAEAEAVLNGEVDDESLDYTEGEVVEAEDIDPDDEYGPIEEVEEAPKKSSKSSKKLSKLDRDVKEVMERSKKKTLPRKAGTTVRPTSKVAAVVEKPVAKPMSKPTTKEEVVETAKSPKPTPKEEPAEKPTVTATEFSHATWDGILRKNVSNTGKVNYAGIKGDKAQLDKYLKSLADNPIQSSWSNKKKQAYWINAYNAYTVKLIVDNYPTSSITQLKGGKPWDAKIAEVGGKKYTLNNIENDILRPTYNDARVHFAVNCAAKSCPPLLNRAWTEDNLNSNYDKQAKSFINNSKYNTISENSVKISKIFEWYADDFGNIITYLNKYSNIKINSDAKVEYMEYDWKLNN